VTKRGGEEEKRRGNKPGPLDELERINRKIGWTPRGLKAQGVGGRAGTETHDGNIRERRREEE